ncbi:hypothetical protein BGW36DRAFT_69800 [Talaromyces proteolyticus]|uniref:Zn(2)-C6 fungal-type domain-containing protein n=1 Tax=Talaromyces proteolyticus TaxID=1131652 RepID=A0AAD4PT82_9EURO|nr:uncharacterized protein BGW36DRAFT_69800 [Talaromyces proteolyticus]KAH8690324.1 hypothetical protein BGW36DRAFT_69800 [Talaromyces proteolyticus]
MYRSYSQIGKFKTKSGCITCKIRHIKCSEERPKCLRCTSTGRLCEYQRAARSPYIASSELPLLTTYRPPHNLLPASQLERRAFHFYFHFVSPSLSGMADFGFWGGTVLQICRSQPLIWDAVISLSALYEHKHTMESSRTKLGPRNYINEQALSWYLRSLATLQANIERGSADLDVSLISCTLFIIIEVLQGNISAALRLYQQGVQLVTYIMSVAGSKAIATATVTNVAPVILRMGTSSLLTKCGSLAPRVASFADVAIAFSTIPEAKRILYAIMWEIRVFDRDYSHKLNSRAASGDQQPSIHALDNMNTTTSFAARQQRLELRLNTWRRNFNTFPQVQNYLSNKTSVGAGQAPTTTQYAGIIATLLMTWLTASILTKTRLDASEAVYDTYDHLFEDMIAHASIALAGPNKQPPFTFEMGIGLPLFITAIKCRNPTLRRKALEYLYQSPPVQGMYVCAAAANIATVVIELEEDCLLSPSESPQQRGNDPGITDRRKKPIDSPPVTIVKHVYDFSLHFPKEDKGLPQTWLKYTRLSQIQRQKDTQIKCGIYEGMAPLSNHFSPCEYMLVMEYYHGLK